MQVRANGLIVFVPKFGIEGLVYLVNKDAPRENLQDATDYVLDEEKQTVKSKDGAVTFTVSGQTSLLTITPSLSTASPVSECWWLYRLSSDVKVSLRVIDFGSHSGRRVTLKHGGCWLDAFAWIGRYNGERLVAGVR